MPVLNSRSKIREASYNRPDTIGSPQLPYDLAALRCIPLSIAPLRPNMGLYSTVVRHP